MFGSLGVRAWRKHTVPNGSGPERLETHKRIAEVVMAAMVAMVVLVGFVVVMVAKHTKKVHRNHIHSDRRVTQGKHMNTLERHRTITQASGRRRIGTHKTYTIRGGVPPPRTPPARAGSNM